MEDKEKDIYRPQLATSSDRIAYTYFQPEGDAERIKLVHHTGEKYWEFIWGFIPVKRTAKENLYDEWDEICWKKLKQNIPAFKLEFNQKEGEFLDSDGNPRIRPYVGIVRKSSIGAGTVDKHFYKTNESAHKEFLELSNSLNFKIKDI